MREARIDSYYDKVEALLKSRKKRLPELADSLQRLTHELAHVVEGVVLRPFPLDMEVIPGHKDPQSKIESDIRQIRKERNWCGDEIRDVTQEIAEYQRLERYVYWLAGKPGDVIRGLYYENCTWDTLQEQMECSRDTIAYHRQIGIKTLADRIYTRTQGI